MRLLGEGTAAAGGRAWDDDAGYSVRNLAPVRLSARSLTPGGRNISLRSEIPAAGSSAVLPRAEPPQSTPETKCAPAT